MKLIFKQRIWLEWLKVYHPNFIKMSEMEVIINNVLKTGSYNKYQQEKLNKMRSSYKKLNNTDRNENIKQTITNELELFF